jgi:hypothetical protein
MGNRTRDLQVFRLVPQPTTVPCAPIIIVAVGIYLQLEAATQMGFDPVTICARTHALSKERIYVLCWVIN